MNLKMTRSLRHIRRFNFHHCNKYETVAEHSFFLSIIAYELAKELDYKRDLILAITTIAMLHDIEESVTGDIPFLIKRRINNINEIEHEARTELGYNADNFNEYMNEDKIQCVVAFADAYELKLYLEEERRSGNVSLHQIECETWGRLHDIDIGDKKVKQNSRRKLEIVRPAVIPEFLTHEGKEDD